MGKLSRTVQRMLPTVLVLERVVSEIQGKVMVYTLPDSPGDIVAAVFR